MAARIILGLGLAAALAAGMVALLVEPPRSGARFEVQTGSVTLQLAAPDKLVTLSPDTRCWRQGCPVISIRARLFSAAPQPAQSEPRRVQHVPPRAFER